MRYSKLLGRIKEVCGTQKEFAKRMKMSSRSLVNKLSGVREWKQSEIIKACSILDIGIKEISIYFFTPKV